MYVHQVGYKKLIDIMMHGQRNIKTGIVVLFQGGDKRCFSTINFPDRYLGPNSFLFIGYQQLFLREYNRRLKVTTHIYLVTSLRIIGAKSPLYHVPLWLTQSSLLYFQACSGMKST
jgi:hypothetical protein